MTQIIKTLPDHVRHVNGERITHLPTVAERLTYKHGLELPHLLNVRGGLAAMIVPSDYSLKVGDSIRNEYTWEVDVTEIVERRKARGDWSMNPYDRHPDYVLLRYL